MSAYGGFQRKLKGTCAIRKKLALMRKENRLLKNLEPLHDCPYIGYVQIIHDGRTLLRSHSYSLDFTRQKATLSYLNVAIIRVIDIHEELFSLVSALTGNKDVTTFTSILRVIEQNDTYDQIRSVYVYTSDVHY